MQLEFVSRARIISVFILLTIFSFNVFCQEGAVDVTSYIPTLISERIKAEDRVKQIKTVKDLPAADVAKARQLYVDRALAKFEPFRTYAAFNIRTGKKPAKEEIQNEVTIAIAGNKEFCDYVDTLLKREKDGKFATELIAIGVELFKFFKKVKADKREATATAFEGVTKWRSWDEIK